MGIAGLLPQLRSITKRAHVSKYRGQTVAVDAYCLLHRGSYGCARELVEGEPTDRHVAYCMSRVDLLVSAGVRPFVVFDGGRLPNKAEEERARERSREEAKARARALWAQGNRAAALECYQKAVDITPAHAKQFVEALKHRNIPFLVAPYEADAQMAYLALNGLVDAVLTEDSDLLCYGCPTVFFKCDKSGEGEEVRLADLPATKELAFQGFGHDLFQEMCVLAGCDFVASLPGIGIKKAHQHLRRTRCFLKVVRSLRFDGTKIPEGYERRVQRALWTFQHQRVFCPRRRAMVHLHEVVGGDLAAGARVPAAAELVDGEPDFLGPMLPDAVAQGIAEGDLDPMTHQPFGDELQPCTAPLGNDAAASGCGMGSQAPRASGKGGGRSGKNALSAGQTQLSSYRGFLRGLAKPSGPAAADFKPPRSSSAGPGSQDSQEQRQQLQQQQQQQRQPAQQQQGEEPEVTSPRAADAGGDGLASPTEEQWARFRQRRQRVGGQAPAAAQVVASAAVGTSKPAQPSTSSYFKQALPSVPGMRRPTAAPQAGGLLARLQAALQQEPSIDDLLSGQDADSAPAVSSGDEEGSQEQQAQQEQQPEWQGAKRQRFAVPVRRQQQQQQQRQQQQPRTPLDLGLPSSPTVDDLLDGSGGAAWQAPVSSVSEEGEQRPSLAGSPLASEQPSRPSQRLWLPQRVGPVQQEGDRRRQQQQQQQPQQLVDLVSPLGMLQQQQQQQQLQQQQQQQQEQQQDGAASGGITPGFYGGSEAGTDPRRLTTVRRVPAATPGSSSPPAGGVAASPLGDGDPIASLSHLPACEEAAEAAVARAAQAAAAAVAEKSLRALPPPRHLQVPTAAPDSSMQQLASASKRPAVENRKENRLLMQRGSKRGKGSGGAKKPATAAAGAAANPFRSFALQ